LRKAAGFGWAIAGLLIAGLTGPVAVAGDDAVKQAIIRESIATYPGNCPCPYNTASNGSRCGKRSAWSRAGGYAPICYPEEVTQEMIERYRKTHGD